MAELKIGHKILFRWYGKEYVGVVVAHIWGNSKFKVARFDENQPFMHDATHLKLVLDDDSVYVPSGSNYYAIDDGVCKILGEI